MKRRGFLAFLAAAPAAPFLPKIPAAAVGISGDIAATPFKYETIAMGFTVNAESEILAELARSIRQTREEVAARVMRRELTA